MKIGPANANLSEVDPEEVKADVQDAVRNLLEALRIDWRADPNTQETPSRVARMLVDEVFRGRYYPVPKLTCFPNTAKLDELYTVGPIQIRSACSHHLVPVIGQAWVGVIPGDKLIGLSKFTRLADWVMSRPQIQEESVVQYADAIEAAIAPRGLAVVVKASHMCMTWRGVRDAGTEMTTSVVRGLLLTEPAVKAEFMELIKGAGFR